MWNDFSTERGQSVTAEVITIPSGAEEIHAYFAHPTDEAERPGIVLFHHMPGWDEFTFEMAERLARHGYSVLCPDLYCRFGHGQPDDIAAGVRQAGGVADTSVLGDAAAALEFLQELPDATGPVGAIGPCSGGRHALLAASVVPGFAAVADLWGGSVVMAPEELNDKRPVAPIDYTESLAAPLLGLFGNDDRRPSPAEVDEHEAALRRHDKAYSFHRYDGAGHGFIYYHTDNYRPAAAMDAWGRILAFFDETLR